MKHEFQLSRNRTRAGGASESSPAQLSQRANRLLRALHLGEFEDGWLLLMKARWEARMIRWDDYAREVNDYAEA